MEQSDVEIIYSIVVVLNRIANGMVEFSVKKTPAHMEKIPVLCAKVDNIKTGCNIFSENIS